MEHGTIEREVQIDASPATVFEVLTDPEHLVEWWPDHADFEPTPGASGTRVFGDRASPEAEVPADHRGRGGAVPALLLPLDPPRRRGGPGGQLAAGHLHADARAGAGPSCA